MAMDKYDIEKDIATDVKKHFDEECEGSWHCVVSPSCLKTSGSFRIWGVEIPPPYLCIARQTVLTGTSQGVRTKTAFVLDVARGC